MQKLDHFKLGMIAVVTIGAVAAITVMLAIRPTSSEEFHAYFDESVQGLEIGGLVKYRGVRIGSVSEIGLAPDGQHVHVTFAIESEHARRLRIAELAPDLRARLSIIGVTGLKLVDIERAGSRPQQVLPFPTERNTIPSTPSVAGKMGRDVEQISNRLPALIDQVIVTLKRVERVADSFERERVAERVGTFLDGAQAAATDLRRLARRLDPGDGLAQRLEATLASVRRATDTLGDTGRALGTGDGLERTLRELRDAARSVRGFFDALERQPDMMVKGRSR